jgi:ribosomal protein L37E
MMRNLLHLCLNQGTDKCHTKIRNVLLPQRIGADGTIPLWPTGKEQEELDKICEKCNEAVFEIKERNCPVCLGTRLDVPLIKGGTVNSLKIFNYKCEDCGRYLFSHKELK